MGDVDFKNALLAGDPSAPPAETTTIPSYAGDIVVRRLTRLEVLGLNRARSRDEIDVAGYEQQMISIAMVTPKMTPAEVKQWQATDVAQGVIGKVSDAITELSGLGEGADKSRVQGARRPRKRA